MVDIQTALGPVPSDQLGLTYGHEHLFVTSAGLRDYYPWLFDTEAELDHTTAELIEAREAGVATIVDVTTPDLGRMPHLMRTVSERSGVKVVIATGLWLDPPRAMREATAEEYADIFQHEIEVGVGGTDIRAGVIKVANADPPGIGTQEEAILRGAAEASTRTGVPTTTHTGPYTIGREQMQVFADTGIAPHLVAIGHSYTGDVEYLREVLEAGHYLSIDRFRWTPNIEGDVIAAIATLCAEGRANRIMLSHDHAPEHNSYRRHGPHESPSGFTYIVNEIRPRMSEAGIPDTDVETMLFEAPRTFLEGGRG